MKEITRQKKNTVTVKDKRPSLFFILLILNRFLLAESFPLFFLFLINY